MRNDRITMKATEALQTAQSEEFALARHLQAVRGTLSAMRLIQISNAHDLAGIRQAASD